MEENKNEETNNHGEVRTEHEARTNRPEFDEHRFNEHYENRERRGRRRRPLQAFVALVIVLVLVFGVSYAGSSLGHDATPALSSTINSAKTDGNAVVTQSEVQISGVAEKVSPSVVSIVSQLGAASSPAGNSVYSYLNGGSPSSPQTSEAAGTGIIVSSDGYIMTNQHVIAGATSISVQLSNGTSYDNVAVIGRDPLNDLAFLKIKNVTGLTAAAIGNSSTIRQGQQVVAIGNALGQYQNTVTSGIVSGTGRPVTAGSSDSTSTETLEDLIQTDAAINSGNSGGPLVNLQGQVIGINTAVASNAQSIGFAIPINATKGVLAGVLQNGKIQRSYLGVAYTTIDPSVQKQYNLSVNKGAYVYASNGSAVVSGSPADKAGLQSKDIITKVNDDTVGGTAGLSTLLAQYRPDTTVALTVLRDGKTITIKATLAVYTGN